MPTAALFALFYLFDLASKLPDQKSAGDIHNCLGGSGSDYYKLFRIIIAFEDGKQEINIFDF